MDLLDYRPLASVPEYRDNRKLARFFCETLGVRDANWEDYLEMLVKTKSRAYFSENVFSSVLRLYQSLSTEMATSKEDWLEIRQAKSYE